MVKRAVLVALLGAALLAQGRAGGGRGFGGFDGLRSSTPPIRNFPYDGRFTFVRINYTTLPGGYWYQGQPAWSHGYPIAERNLMNILEALTTLGPHTEEINSLALDDPEVFKYPVIYLIEAGWWDMSDAE